jgi:hypothetical protein
MERRIFDMRYGAYDLEIDGELDLTMTLIGDKDTEIINSFTVYMFYTTEQINDIINKIIKGKYPKNTTTKIFKTLFKTTRGSHKIDGKWFRTWDILGIK